MNLSLFLCGSSEYMLFKQTKRKGASPMNLGVEARYEANALAAATVQSLLLLRESPDSSRPNVSRHLIFVR